MIKNFLNFFFPPICCSCNARVSYETALCYKCWSKVRFLSNYYCCKVCGNNTEYLEDSDTICISCQAHPPIYKKSKSVFIYDEHTNNMITSFKFSDNTSMANIYAKWILNDCLDILEKTDVLIPVPLHFLRLLKRKYNQSALLCNEISKLYNVNISYNSLKRIKNTVPQVGLEYKRRINNVKGVFSVINNKNIINKSVTIVDDVTTTGATITSCCKALIKAKVKEVNVITLSRTSI